MSTIHIRTIHVLLIITMIIDILITLFYYLFEELLFYIFLLFTSFMMDLCLSKIYNNNWKIFVAIEWSTTRAILIFISIIFYGYDSIWMYIILCTYPIIIIFACIDLDYLGIRALIPDVYYVLIALSYDYYVILFAITIPMLIRIYYYIYT